MKNTTLDYKFLLPIPNAFTVDTEEYYARYCKVNDANAHFLP